METQIRLVEEDQARAAVKDVFEDIKRTMDLPYVPDLFRAMASYPPFLNAVWSETKPIIGRPSFEGLADRVRAHARACALRRFYVPDHLSSLRHRGLSDAEIEPLRRTVDCLHEADPRILLIALAVTRSVSGSPAASRLPAASLGRSMACPQLGPLAGELQECLGARVIGGDLALLAQWPEYLRTAWNDVKAQVRSAEFRRHVAEISDIALGGLRESGTSRIVEALGAADAGLPLGQLGPALGIVADFGRALPAVIQVVALFRVGLQPVLADQLLELEAEA